MNPIIIAKDGFGGSRNKEIVEELNHKHGVEAILGDIPIDVMWTTSAGQMVMGDFKKPADLIASVKDGRLHNQTSHFRDPNIYGFILIESDAVSFDGGYMVGNEYSYWTWEQFDGLLESMQEEGIVIVRSPHERFTPRRLAYMYRRLNEESHGSWHRPIAELPPAKDFLDSEYREKVGFLMHIGRNLGSRRGQRGMGQVNAEKMLSEFGLMGALGITEESLEEAAKRWVGLKGVGTKSIDQWKRWIKG